MTQIQVSPSEDKILIAYRERLQRVWYNDVSTVNKNDWHSYWFFNPPPDITGRTYSPFAPTTMLQTQVDLATTYAWSQIYGVYRFGLAPILNPIPITAVTSTLIPLVAKPNKIIFTVDLVPFVGTQRRIIIYCTQSHGPLKGNSLARMRPIGWTTQQLNPSAYNGSAGYVYRFGNELPGIIDLTMATVDENNTLRPSPIVASLELT